MVYAGSQQSCKANHIWTVVWGGLELKHWSRSLGTDNEWVFKVLWNRSVRVFTFWVTANNTCGLLPRCMATPRPDTNWYILLKVYNPSLNICYNIFLRHTLPYLDQIYAILKVIILTLINMKKKSTNNKINLGLNSNIKPSSIGVIVSEKFCFRKCICLTLKTISCQTDKGNRIKQCQI